MDAIFLLKINFSIYCVAFAACLIKNRNFNIALVGLTYLAPLIPLRMTDANIERFLVVSFSNFIFGIIEMVIFVLTERPEDITFDKPYFLQLFGHVLPICVALVGMSFVSRATDIAVGWGEGMLIAGLFFVGSVFRIWSIVQLGVLRFKFNIAFREKQTLKTDQLHGLMRHPTYTAMMLVILAYGVTPHSWAHFRPGLVSSLESILKNGLLSSSLARNMRVTATKPLCGCRFCIENQRVAGTNGGGGPGGVS